MSLPQSLRESASPAELEFIASQQLLEIIPLIAMERTVFISGTYGPLQPPRRAKVPIWLATNLKLKKKCRIIPPDWLTVGTFATFLILERPLNNRLDHLRDCCEEETNNPKFSKLPFRFAEVAKVLLDVAPDDLEDADQLRLLLKNLREARQAKTRDGLQNLNPNELHVENMCSMEINEIRPFFVQSMAILGQLTRRPAAEADISAFAD
ncbi:Psf2-domain-containing protein [Schizophyllum commune H4-8]|uniref:DNA replication complex GINS protein PSF2 n=1 Tax=Schizophyllum commune (strain H4-8 / FGSC 9210) TaxID=578458 RepID=D8PS58_SCHCM|nr:Psf2-domain-containing protein [Schizophyllum commune H4-8]KAI5893957.1 Psf2-domain-containing protein [Schizophyllum commune H4-8]